MGEWLTPGLSFFSTSAKTLAGENYQPPHYSFNFQLPAVNVMLIPSPLSHTEL